MSNNTSLSELDPLPADVPAYFPAADGRYQVKPGFFALGADLGGGVADRQVFQLDSGFAAYRRCKLRARAEDLGKYWCTKALPAAVAAEIARFIVRRLVAEHPGDFALEQDQASARILHCRRSGEALYFDRAMRLVRVEGQIGVEPEYDSALDGLMAQVQEDAAIVCRAEDGADWLAAVHLCFPNHWAAADKVGGNFAQVHRPVAGMEELNARSQSIVRGMIERGPYVRFAWGLSTDARLNHHPLAPAGIDPQLWQGRHFEVLRPRLFCRVERQVLWGFPAYQAALFTIRTYFVDCAQLSVQRRAQLAAALESMAPDSLVYKGLDADRDAIVAWLTTS